MSIINIELDKDKARIVRNLVEGLIDGVLGLGDNVDLHLPEPFIVTKTVKDDHVEITWNANPEVDIPGPLNPDLIIARCWPTETRIFLRMSDIRIGHAG
jgi:hypothetical protein